MKTIREFFQILAAIPKVTFGVIQAAQIRPGDTVIIRTDARLNEDGRRFISKNIKEIWPDVKVIILDSGFELTIVNKQSGAA